MNSGYAASSRFTDFELTGLARARADQNAALHEVATQFESMFNDAQKHANKADRRIVRWSDYAEVYENV